MINSVKSTLAATALVLTLATPGFLAQAETASDGVVTVKSGYSVAETVSRIKKDVADKGITLFGVIDQAKLGNAAGNVVRPSRLIM
ncbi:MAG: chromosome condensation protein CrcB, partial [Mesorhizobium sp.]